MFPAERTDLADVADVADERLAGWVAEVRRSAGPGPQILGPGRLREAARQRVRPPGPGLADVRDLSTPGGLPLRLYRPAPEPHPLVIYLPGGAIAVLAAVRLRDLGTPASALLLACPNADLTLDWPSVEREGHG